MRRRFTRLRLTLGETPLIARLLANAPLPEEVRRDIATRIPGVLPKAIGAK